MKEQEQQIKEIIEKLHLLPVEAKVAVCWLFDNIDLIERIVDGDDISKSQLELYIEKKIKIKLYILFEINCNYYSTILRW